MDWLGIGDQGGAFVEGIPEDPQTGNPKGFTAAPRFGALWEYASQEKLYICPEDKEGESDQTMLGGGGNGKFSYTMFSNLGLRSPERIPSRLADRVAGGSRGGSSTPRRLNTRPFSKVPLFVEEHPSGINNKTSSGHMEGNFNFNTDWVVARHGSMEKRPGFQPGSADVTSFSQGATNIAFADGHVESVKINYGFTARQVRPEPDGEGLEGIPYTAEGLLYYYGIEYEVITIDNL
jgi:prepilin-type processing-associated H-X9-DG protein